MKDDLAASEEIKTSIALLEQDRSFITDDSDRASYFDLAQSTYDLAIDFTYSSLHENIATFNYSEASRARSLLDLVSAGGEVVNNRNGVGIRVSAVSRPLVLDEIQRRLPGQLSNIAVLGARREGHCLGDLQEFDPSFDRRVAPGELEQNVTAFLSAVTKETSRDIDDIDRRAKSLYEILIKPVSPVLRPDGVIFIVPDKILNYLPFGALVCPESGRRLVEDYVLEFAPSSSLVISCSDRATERAGQPDRKVLAIGNPSFDRSKFPSLPDLPAAAGEAESIARLYSVVPVTGLDAQAPRVKAQMPDADVIHFAGHYVADERDPMLSRLLLSKTTGRDDGAKESLTASDVYRMALHRARLVVLSACGTGVERYYRGEGAIGIARPFITAPGCGEPMAGRIRTDVSIYDRFSQAPQAGWHERRSRSAPGPA